MRTRNQYKLAEKAKITAAFLSELKKGRKNASPLRAKRLAKLTKSDPFIWMQGGDVAKRNEAVEKWAAKEGKK